MWNASHWSITADALERRSLSRHAMPNRLINETSPYLLQHAHNPVDWYAWGEKRSNAPASEDKPILLSIGYSACHWCHVMEHESFENDAIAKLMNDNFVNIKVDREERPDLDQIYMNAVQMMTGSGGWPLTVFLLPSGEPFFGGTYFPPEDRYGRPGFPPRSGNDCRRPTERGATKSRTTRSSCGEHLNQQTCRERGRNVSTSAVLERRGACARQPLSIRAKEASAARRSFRRA